MRVKMFYLHDFSFILHCSDFVKHHPWKAGIHTCIGSHFAGTSTSCSSGSTLHNPNEHAAYSKPQALLLPLASGGCLLHLCRCWCSCGGGENNWSTSVDNAEIDSIPSQISPVEVALNTVQVCLYSLWSHCQQMDWLQHLLLRAGPGWASREESWDDPVCLWFCVSAKGILLLRYAVQHRSQCCLAGCLL